MPSIADLLSQEELIRTIRQSLPDDSAKEAFDQAVASRKQSVISNKFIIAVLGIQGAGKSSLLNALVVGDDILPVEADETTCIPVEIHKCIEGEPCYIVKFKDGRETSAPIDREELNRLVNHEFNPNNQLGIHHIELHIHSPLLRPDVVFVDLPGVASLSAANQETTMKYIMSCSAAIFLLRTVPPITRIESLFLRAVWPQLSNAYFVQNWWENETRRELEGGMSHNHGVLTKISSEIGVPYSRGIMPVQIKDAVLATYTEDKALRDRSGIPVLEETIDNSLQTWSKDVVWDNVVWLEQKIVESIRINELIAQDLQKNADTSKMELMEQQRKFEEERETINSRFDELKEQSEQLAGGVRKIMSSFTDDLEDKVLQAISGKISTGVYDGHYFETIVTEQLQEAQLTVINELQFQIQDAAKKILVNFESILKQLNESKPEFDFEVKSEGSFKFERTIPTVASLGLMAAAPVLLGLLVSNPAGWVVAGAVAVAGLVGTLLGYSVKSTIENRRKAAALKSAKSIVTEVMEQLRDMVKRETKQYMTRLIQELEKLLVDQLNQIEAEFNQRRAIIDQSLLNHDALVRDTSLSLEILRRAKEAVDKLSVTVSGEAVS
ncbi:dynamin family protein [Paenibacillus hamazuiensis]|uniref:dynamin family protein n=1 Tax=Paenibacillus hamazuiensis TaxID=2936508 RepID=UPI00200D5B49|nr:dynamin family protein [Paenibacillus hamazuiensis]